jgi:hypothetical protein
MSSIESIYGIRKNNKGRKSGKPVTVPSAATTHKVSAAYEGMQLQLHTLSNQLAEQRQLYRELEIENRSLKRVSAISMESRRMISR